MTGTNSTSNVAYESARQSLLNDLSKIVTLEQECMDLLFKILEEQALNIREDYDKAIAIQDYWFRYPPEQRGRKPTGDAFPWGEVGEKVIEGYIYSSIYRYFQNVRFVGLPYGHDVRFKTDKAFIQIDIKSTGPNDNADEVVCSRNQVSGDGLYNDEFGVYNSPFTVIGKGSKSMEFQPELPPFYIIDANILPTLTYYLKCVYLVKKPGDQPLTYLELICVPNGLLMFDGPKYASSIKGLLAIGKDEQKTKRKRTRIKLRPLINQDRWRCKQIIYSTDSFTVASRKPTVNVSEATQIKLWNMDI